MLNGLDICAGSGIGSWAFWRSGFARTVCYIENDPYCQRVLQARMADGSLPDAPIWDDLKTFDGRPWRGCVDFVFGGIPCQPYSLAGKRQGAADERDLWPALRRVLGEVEPGLVFLEQVPGFLVHSGGMGRVLGELAKIGYDTVWDCVPACAVGAPHRRDRVWILAYPGSTGRQQVTGVAHGDESANERGASPEMHEFTGIREGRPSGNVAYPNNAGNRTSTRDTDIDWKTDDAGWNGFTLPWSGGCREDVAYPFGTRLEGRSGLGSHTCEEQSAAERDGDTIPDTNQSGRSGRSWQFRTPRRGELADGGQWAVEPDVGRSIDGLALGLDLLRKLDFSTTGVYYGS